MEDDDQMENIIDDKLVNNDDDLNLMENDNNNDDDHLNGADDEEGDEDAEGDGEGDVEDDEGDEDEDDKEVDDDDDNENEEEDEDDEDLLLQASISTNTKKTKRSSKDKKGRKTKRKRSNVSRFFTDQAEVADDSDSDVDEGPTERGQEQILDKDVLQAVERVEKRHEANRKRLNMSAEELAKEYEERAREEVRFTQYRGNMMGDDDIRSLPPNRVHALAKQSLLPSISDPGIYRVKCTPGKELALVRSIMLKAMDHKQKTGILRIKSAFCTSSKGMIYIEALAEPFAKEALAGLYGFYMKSFARIPVEEMTSVFNVSFKKKPLVTGQWVRLRRGALKGDLAQVVTLFDGGSRVIIKAVPRPDYKGSYNKSTDKTVSTSKGIRPSQRLFDPEEVRAVTGSLPERQKFGLDKEMFDFFNNDYYKDGFLYKEVNAATYIQSVDVNPKIEELQYFLSKQKDNKIGSNDNNGNDIDILDKINKKSHKNDDNDNDNDNDDNDSIDGNDADDNKIIKKLPNNTSNDSTNNTTNNSSADSTSNINILREIAKQLTISGVDSIDDSTSLNQKKKMFSFVIGDLVQVVSGELKNLIGKVIAVNEITKIVKIKPKSSSLHVDMDIEADIIIKYITPGAHVKIISGNNSGQTGRVVSVNMIDNDNIAAILTDGTNTEILCNINYLQLSEEVAAGLSSLMGYELYDLVIVNENETACVINVGAERLRVINHMDIVKEIMPQELHGKRNTQSFRSTAFDGQNNTLKVGDTVNVTSSTYVNRSGTIKHIMKGMLWIHSNSFLKNSGIFVIKGRSCVLAGSNRRQQNEMSNAILNNGLFGIGSTVAKPTIATGKPVHKPNSTYGSKYSGKDPDIGKTVRIIKGGFKGLLGQVVEATPTHYSLELLSRFKKIAIEKEKTVIVGTKEGSLTQTYNENAPTDYFNIATPAQLPNTPRVGNETPYGDATPAAGNDSAWGITGDDSVWGLGNTPSGSNSVHHTPSWNQSPFTPTIPSYSPTLNQSYSPNNVIEPVKKSVAVMSPSEWVVGLKVVIKKGNYLGREGIIESLSDNSQVDNFRIKIVDTEIRLNLSSNDLSLVEPLTNNKVIVLSGKHKGVTGSLQMIKGKDAFVKTNENKSEIFRFNLIGVLYE